MGSPEKPIDVEMGDMEESSQLNPQVEIKENEKLEDEDRFTGLKKQELLDISSQRQWVIARWILFVIFWAAWVGMLVGAIIIVVQAPRCAPEPTPPWYQDTVVYQANVEKFADGLKGMKEHVGYVKSLNSKTLTVCHANDVDDLSKVADDDTTGFIALVEASHNEEEDKNLRVVIDLRVDAISTTGPEFVKSATMECAGASPTGEACDLFQWKANDSLPADGTMNWVYHPQRGENYRSTGGADGLAYINYATGSGLAYLETVVRKWVVDYKVDGFQLRDMSVIANQTDVMNLVKALQDVFNETQSTLEEKDRKVIGLFLLGSDESTQGTFYPEGNDTDAAAISITTALSKADTAEKMRKAIETWRSATEPFIGAYAVNTMEQSPLAVKLGAKKAAGLILLAYSLPGVPVLKSGDEALLLNDKITWNETAPSSNEPNAPNNGSMDNINMVRRIADFRVNQYSSKRSLRWDNEDAVFEFRKTNNTDVIAFTRKWDTKPTTLVVHNPTDSNVTVMVTKMEKEKEKASVIVASMAEIMKKEEKEYSLKALALQPGLTLVLEIETD